MTLWVYRGYFETPLQEQGKKCAYAFPTLFSLAFAEAIQGGKERGGEPTWPQRCWRPVDYIGFSDTDHCEVAASLMMGTAPKS